MSHPDAEHARLTARPERAPALLVSSILLLEASLFTCLAPLLPQYAEELGLSTFGAGVLSASYAAGMLIGGLPGAWLAARVGARRTTLVATGVTVASTLGFAVVHETGPLLLLRFCQGLAGAAVWVAALAWLVTTMAGAHRARLIGTALGASIAGATIGPAIGAVGTTVDRSALFAALALSLAVLGAWIYLTPAEVTSSEPQIRQPWSRIRRPAIIAASSLVALPALLLGAIAVLVPLRLDELGASGRTIGVVMLVGAVFESGFTYFLGGTSDRFGRAGTIRLGLALCAIAALTLPLPRTKVLLAVVVAFACMAIGFIWPAIIAHLSEQTDLAGLDQAFAFAVTNTAFSGGIVAGGIGAARLAEMFTEWVAYPVAAVLFLFALTVLGRVMRETRTTGCTSG